MEMGKGWTEATLWELQLSSVWWKGMDLGRGSWLLMCSGQRGRRAGRRENDIKQR